MTSTAALARANAAVPPEPAAIQAAAAGGARAAGSPIADGFVDLAYDAGALALSAVLGRKVSVARSSSSKKSTTKASSKTTTAKASTAKAAAKPASAYPRELAFLDDKKMSVQEKIFRLLLHLQEKSDRELDKKMKEYMAASKKAEDGAKGGWIGQALGIVRQIMPGLDLGLDLLESQAGRQLLQQLSGPVLAAAATAVGAPHLAPVLSAVGPELVAGALEAYDGLSKAAGASPSGGTGAAKEQDPADEKTLATELQYLQERQRAMTTLLSNTMRAMHETSMAVIQNIR